MEDDVGVDYGDDGDDYEADTGCDKELFVLVCPGPNDQHQEAKEDCKLQNVEYQSLLLVMYNGELLVVNKANDWEEDVEDSWSVSILFDIKRFLKVSSFIFII